jgi:hypothetical protein
VAKAFAVMPAGVQEILAQHLTGMNRLHSVLYRHARFLSGSRTVSTSSAPALVHRKQTRHCSLTKLERQRGKPSVVDLAARFSRDLRARGKPKRGRKADKRFFDELSGNE